MKGKVSSPQQQSMQRSQKRESKRDSRGWVLDSELSFCQICGNKWSLITRRHHCRQCGGLICSNCSIFRSPELFDFDQQKQQSSKPQKQVKPEDNPNFVRCCTNCSRDFEEYEKLVTQVRSLKERRQWKELLPLLERNLEEFEKSFQQSLQSKRAEIAILSELGIVFKELGQPEDAVRMHERALKIAETLNFEVKLM